ncbi:MAG: GYF domain-containing protein [Proteiniphilum sp.]|jgi:hypothetical protein|nr:GYF domain-containing protein [Proteiniphilum sp.]
MNHYFYIDGEGKQKGTFSPEELGREGIKRDTLVWTQGMEQWKRAGETEELNFLFSDTYGRFRTVAEQPSARYGRPGESGQPQALPPMPKSWLTEAILATFLPLLLCSSILSLFGIIAIVHAAQVESSYSRGDYAASLESSRSAAKWTKISLWIAAGWTIFLVILMILLFVFVGSFRGIAEMGDLLNT